MKRMFVMKAKFIVILSFVLGLLLNACGLSAPTIVHRPTALPNPAVSIAMKSPDNGTMYSVGSEVPLMAVFTSSSTIRTRSFLANGVAVGTSIVAGSASDFQSTWTPRTAGEYYIQAKVILRDGSAAISDPVRVCVMSYTSAGTFHPAGYTGLCQIPTQIPNSPTSGALTVDAVSIPSSIWFSDICPSYPNVTFIARVNDPQDLVAFVDVSIYEYVNYNLQNSLYMNWITTRADPVNQKEYRRTIQFDSSFPYNTSRSILWTVTTIGRDGHVLVQADGEINIQRLNCSQQHLETAPSATPAPLQIIPSETPTPTLVAPPTFTLKKNAFCRKGPDMSFPDVTAIPKGDTVDILNVSEDGFWYFVYWQKFNEKCWVGTSTGDPAGDITGLKVLAGPALPAPEPALPPASSCSSYADASSCTTNGCSWDKSTNSCK